MAVAGGRSPGGAGSSHISPEVPPLTKKLTPLKAASAVFAGLLVLGSGMAVAGACLSDSSKPDQAEVVDSGQTDASLIAQPGSEIDDHSADEVDDDKGVEIDENDQGDHDAADHGEIKVGDDGHGDDVESGVP